MLLNASGDTNGDDTEGEGDGNSGNTFDYTFEINFKESDGSAWNFDDYRSLGFRIFPALSGIEYSFEWSNGETATWNTNNGGIPVYSQSTAPSNKLTVKLKNIPDESDDAMSIMCIVNNMAISRATLNGTDLQNTYWTITKNGSDVIDLYKAKTYDYTFDINFKKIDGTAWDFDNYNQLNGICLKYDSGEGVLQPYTSSYTYELSNGQTGSGTTYQGIIRIKPEDGEACTSASITIKNLREDFDKDLYIEVSDSNLKLSKKALDGTVVAEETISSKIIKDGTASIDLYSVELYDYEVNIDFKKKDGSDWNFDDYANINYIKAELTEEMKEIMSTSEISYSYEWSNGQTGSGKANSNGEIVIKPSESTPSSSVKITIKNLPLVDGLNPSIIIDTSKFDLYKTVVNGEEIDSQSSEITGVVSKDDSLNVTLYRGDSYSYTFDITFKNEDGSDWESGINISQALIYTENEEGTNPISNCPYTRTWGTKESTGTTGSYGSISLSRIDSNSNKLVVKISNVPADLDEDVLLKILLDNLIISKVVKNGEEVEDFNGNIIQKVEDGNSLSLDVYLTEIRSLEDWQYKLDYENNEIILKRYIGNETEVKVPASATVGGKEYKTVLGEEGGAAPFNGTQVEKVTVEDGAKLAKNNYNLFKSNNLKEVDLTGADVSEVESMNTWFYGDSSLEKVNLSGLNAENVTNMNYILSNCPNLTEVNMDGFSAPNVEETYGLFRNDTSLESLKIEGIGTIMEDAEILTGCENLKKVSLKNIGSVKRYAMYPYSGNQTLEEVTLEECSLENLAICNCTNLTTINFVGSNNKLEKGAFYVDPMDSLDQKFPSYGDVTEPLYLLTNVNSEDPAMYDYKWGSNNRAIASKQAHKLTYDSNGGNEENTTQEYMSGDKVKQETPTRDGYSFRGWNTKQNGSGQYYVADEVIYKDEDITLYAQWRRPDYTNEEHTEGWCGENVKWKAENGTLTIYTEGDGDGKMYDYSIQDYTHPFTPWNGRDDNSVDFNKLIIDEGVTYIGAYAFASNDSLEKVTLPDSLEEIGDGAFYESYITTIENLDENIKLGQHPFFEVKEENTIHLDSNGGSFEGGESTKDYTAKVELYGTTIETRDPIEFEEPTKPGFKFIGWNTKADGSGDVIKTPYVHELPFDYTYYAMWADAPITVTYNTNGGEFIKESEQLYTNDKLPEEMPTKEGYGFVEWNTEPDGTGKRYFEGDIIRESEDVTLYAIWGEIAFASPVGRGSNGSVYGLCDVVDKDGNELEGIVMAQFHNDAGATYITSNEFVEVSQDYIKKFLNNLGLEERDFDKLKTILATGREYNVGGFVDTFGDGETYDEINDAYMLQQYTGKVMDSIHYTSNNGEFWLKSTNKRMKYVYDNYKEIGPKFDLKVFRNGKTVIVGIERRPISILVQKTDEEDNLLEGAELQLIDKNGNIIKTWTSTTAPEEILVSQEGTYTLRELSAPDGYIKIEDIEFKVDDDGNIILNGENKEILSIKNTKEEEPVQPEEPVEEEPKEEQKEETPEEKIEEVAVEEKSVSIKTGDGMMLYTAILAIALGGVLSIIILKKKA